MTVLIARTAGNKLARRSALDLQAALEGVGIDDLTVRNLRDDFDEHGFESAIAQIRALGVDAVEVPMAILDAQREAMRELAAM